MREIEFRAWLGNQKRMVKCIGLLTMQKELMCFSEDGHEIEIIDYREGTDNIQLMQYTGLKDKNGVKIFEGDIVKDDRERIFVIEYKFGGFNIVPIDYYNDEFSWNPLGDMQTAGWLNESAKIIGNIYENCEFLEVK